MEHCLLASLKQLNENFLDVVQVTPERFSLLTGSMDLAFTAAQVAVSFAPVPWLSPVVSAVCGIIQLCQNVTANRNLILDLQNRCYSLLLALHDSGKDAQDALPDRLLEALNVANNTLLAIQSKLETWARLKTVPAIFHQKEITDGIQRFNVDISDCLIRFQIASHRDIHNWQDQFKTSRERDHKEMMEYFSENENLQNMIYETVSETSEKVDILARWMQNHLEIIDREDPMRKGLQSNLYQLTRESGRLLPDLNLKCGMVRIIGRCPVDGTSVMDIYEGLYLESEKVSVKLIRAFSVNDKSLRRFMREVKIWGDVWRVDRGRHVLPFYGFGQDGTNGPWYMVSPWQKNGNAINYVKVNDSKISYQKLIRGIAEGLRVLHTMNPPVIHGDIKGANIIINDEGRPLIADFGLSRIVEDVTGVPFTQSHVFSDSYRWMAPEVALGPEVLSTHSDIYSFARTALELITHQPPYSHIRKNNAVFMLLSQGDNPIRPTDPVVIARGFDDKLWNLIVKCWTFEPTSRPNVHDVLALY